MVPANRAAAVAAELAEIRDVYGPQEGDPGTVLTHCQDCGQVFIRDVDDDRRYCSRCGASRQVDANTQMRLKSGPVYEKATRAQFRFWSAEMRRLGLHPGVDQ